MEEDAACDSTWDDSGADSDGSSGGGGDGGGGPGDADGDDEAGREARPDLLQVRRPARGSPGCPPEVSGDGGTRPRLPIPDPEPPPGHRQRRG